MADALTQALEDAITLLARLSAEQAGALNRVKLAKLLYLLDLSAWRKIGRGVTGIEWRWDNYGPYSSVIPETCARMGTTGELTLTATLNYHGFAEYRIRSKEPRYFREPDTATKELARELMSEYGLWTASALKDLTYKTEPMQRIQNQGSRGDILELASQLQTTAAVAEVVARYARRRRTALGENVGDYAGAIRQDLADLEFSRNVATRKLLDGE